ncbi:hypothetical protein [Nostoc sp. FACHB-110]|uniref:hypothetical protein n=1 Tax=Nostoc sp. FACHB-110 TaxID=2692834 RepID=UPI00168998DA|nr:hypothetical protein [Nostoc sp. FACHB-110]MBD2436585.1 hypothetical protein [Nostoc sp. FACHB-110]
MSKLNLQSLKKNFKYEVDYLLSKFKLSQAVVFIITLLCLVVTGLGDTTSFFNSNNSFIPKDWTWFNSKKFVNLLAACIILIPSILTWLNEFKRQSQEYSEISELVVENVIPRIQNELIIFKENLKTKFNISDNIRLSVFVPIRYSLCNWKLQMVCKTSNIPDKELIAAFALNEGVLGYTFFKTRKQHIEFIDVSNNNNLPSKYVPLNQDNFNLINRDIKAVLVVSAFQNGSVAGLLAIDTENLLDLSKMEDYKLHSDALDWIIARSKAVKWIWRIKNNV